ncbi:MAG: hypothetical protein V2A72_06850 [Candidatus Omnitrophota bacterium]
MAKQLITRRQKDMSRLLREKRKAHLLSANVLGGRKRGMYENK